MANGKHLRGFLGSQPHTNRTLIVAMSNMSTTAQPRRRPVFVRIKYAHRDVPLRDGERYNFSTGWMGRAAAARFWSDMLKDWAACDAIGEYRRYP